jgi:hypothetical protein
MPEASQEHLQLCLTSLRHTFSLNSFHQNTVVSFISCIALQFGYLSRARRSSAIGIVIQFGSSFFPREEPKGTNLEARGLPMHHYYSPLFNRHANISKVKRKSNGCTRLRLRLNLMAETTLQASTASWRIRVKSRGSKKGSDWL